MRRYSGRVGLGFYQRRKDSSDRAPRYFRSAALPPGGEVQLDFGPLRGRVLGLRGAAPTTHNISCCDNSPALRGEESL